MRKSLFIMLLCVVLLVTGCTGVDLGGNSDDQNNNQNNEEEKLEYIDLESNTRPIAVMINNHKAAQPNHAGLQDAYLVYEIIVEGGITRLMAVFKDQTTERVGSVRSARHYYLDYALENDAIYVHFGGSTIAKEQLKSLKINDVDGMNDSGFWRDRTLNVATEHTAFTKITNIKNAATKKGYRMTSDKDLLLNYSGKEIDLSSKTGAVVANTVTIPYSNYTTTKYIYDATNKVYKRYINDKAHTDGVTKTQYTTKNIIVANIRNYDIGGTLQELDNIGTGSGYFITDGYAMPIKWSKTSRSSQTVYSYLDGTEITVNDGNTYIQIQPTDKKTTFN